jgi:hypothetical protein
LGDVNAGFVTAQLYCAGENFLQSLFNSKWTCHAQRVEACNQLEMENMFVPFRAPPLSQNIHQK